MKAVLLAAVLAVGWPMVSQAASAPLDRVWYVLNFPGGECVAAALLMPASPTPAQFDRNTRAAGGKDSIRAGKDVHGKLHFVAITVKQASGEPPVTMFWFPTRSLCGEGRSAAVAAGVVSANRESP